MWQTSLAIEGLYLTLLAVVCFFIYAVVCFYIHVAAPVCFFILVVVCFFMHSIVCFFIHVVARFYSYMFPYTCGFSIHEVTVIIRLHVKLLRVGRYGQATGTLLRRHHGVGSSASSTP